MSFQSTTISGGTALGLRQSGAQTNMGYSSFADIAGDYCEACGCYHSSDTNRTFQYGCPVSGYKSIKIGSLDLMTLQKRVADLEAQVESFEALVAQLMISLNQNKRSANGSAE